MTSNKEEFYTFIKKSEKFQENNDDYLMEIKDSLNNTGELPVFDSKRQESQSVLANELSNFIGQKVSLFADKELLNDVKIDSHMANIQKIIDSLEQYKSQILNKDRSFKDMVLSGPENMAEVSLLESATTFLEPHELDGAVREDFPASSVIGKIEDSKKMKDNRQFSMQHQERIMAMQQDKDKQKQNKNTQNEVQSLGQEFGVLDSMVKSMRYSDKMKNPDISPNASEKPKGISLG